jgi:hypothetical protein
VKAERLGILGEENARPMWVFPVPLLPRASTFSRWPIHSHSDCFVAGSGPGGSLSGTKNPPPLTKTKVALTLKREGADVC